MKRIIIGISASFLLVACGAEEKKSIEEIVASNDLVEIRAKRSEVVNEQILITEQLSKLDRRIAELDDTKKISLITSATTTEETFKHYIEFQGNVSTKNLLIIYPEFAGILTKVNVKEGDKVTEGQILARIDDGGLNQQLAQMKIQLGLSKTIFERQERLWKDKIGSEIQYLQAKTAYEGQEKSLSQMEEQINKTFVKAPFSGIIDEIITEQGALVNPGQSPLMRIINLNKMYIETNVPENYIASVTKNKDVEVEFPVTGMVINAKVGQVGNYINPANRTFKIEIPLSNKDKKLKPNLTAKIKINDYTNTNALLIPQSIISENAKGEQYIYLVKNRKENSGVAKKVIIETGQIQGDFVEVLKGLKNGDETVREGARSIQDGQEVKIINKD